MTNKEIKLRLIEAFINTKDGVTLSELIEKVDRLVDYINKDNLEEEKKECSKISHEIVENVLEQKLSEENLRKIYFDFYDKMEEPERIEAMENWSYNYCKGMIPETVHGAIILGFNWITSKQGNNYWLNIYNNTHN